MSARWDARYAAGDAPVDPVPAVVEVCGALPPGRAVDLACGAGRHARWLAGRGWSVCAVDSSAVGVAQGEALGAGLDVTWTVADALTWQPAQDVDLVLVVHVQLGVAGLRRAAGWLAPDGLLVVLGHEHGLRDPSLLHTEEQLRAAAADLRVERLERRDAARDRNTGTGTDRPQLLLVARAPSGPQR